MIFKVDYYTDKAHILMKALFYTARIAHTKGQIRKWIEKHLNLSADTTQQDQILNAIVTTGLKKLVQCGVIDEVHSKLSTEKQWMLHEAVSESGYISFTDENRHRATSQKARKLASSRALSDYDLHRLNQQ